MMTETIMLGWIDYALFGLLLLISSSIGVYFRFSGGKQKTTQEFLLAGKNMSVLPVAFSIMATVFSAGNLIGGPAEVYKFGFQFTFVTLGSVCSTILVAYRFLPVYFEMEITTAHEYLDRRFGKQIRILTSASFLIQQMLMMGVVLYAPAVSLSAITNFSIPTSVISMGVVCTFYSTLGGLKAILWTDVFQAIMMYLCVFSILIKGSMDVGGIGDVYHIASKGGRLLLPGTEIDPTVRYTWWNLILNGTVLFLSAHAANQVQVQRLMAVKDLKRSIKALVLSIVMNVTFQVLVCCVGIVIYANFAGCDPLKYEDNPISRPDQLLPYFVMKSLGHIPGLTGICICGIFSASLSTMSSTVNSLVIVTMEDIGKPLCKIDNITPWKEILVAKALTIFYGLFCIAFTFMISAFENLMQASMIIFSIFAGPVFGVFFLGIMTTRSNQEGTIVGLLTSLVFIGWVSFGATYAGPIWEGLPFSTSECDVEHLNLTGTVEVASQNVIHDVYQNFSTAIHAVSLEGSTIFSEDLYNTSNGTNTNNENYIFPLYKISLMWFGVIGFVTATVIGYLSSVCIDFWKGEVPNMEPQVITTSIKMESMVGDNSQKENQSPLRVLDHKIK